MLTIRNAQMNVFAREARSRFEERLVELFMNHYPRECRQAGGRTQVHRWVRQGIKAAALRGYTSQRQVSIYISLMMMLGADFAHDPQLSWAAEGLDQDAIADPTLRIESLFDDTLDYLETIAGEGGGLIVRALLRIRAFDLTKVPDGEGEAWVDAVLEILREFYPQKFEYQGEEVTRTLIADGIAKAGQYGLHKPLGVFVVAELMFMMGSGFDRDPLHPWAGAILTDAGIATEEERARRLYAAALAHVEESLKSG